MFREATAGLVFAGDNGDFLFVIESGTLEWLGKYWKCCPFDLKVFCHRNLSRTATPHRRTAWTRIVVNHCDKL